MSKPLTDALVRTAKPPERGQSLITDSTLRNFALRLSQGGAKTFVVSLGRGKRHTIGHYPTITLSEARTAAKRILAERELGKITPERVPFDDAAADFLRDCKTRVRPRTLKNYTDYLRMLPFNRRPVASITPREIVVILNNQVPSQRGQLHRVARNFFRWCIRQHILDRSPLNALPVPTGRPRARVLTEDELRAVWRSARSLATPHHAIVALLVLTGQRRGEIARLEWDWVRATASSSPPRSQKIIVRGASRLALSVKTILLVSVKWSARPTSSPPPASAKRPQPRSTVGARPRPSSTRSVVSPDTRCTICGAPTAPPTPSSALSKSSSRSCLITSPVARFPP